MTGRICLWFVLLAGTGARPCPVAWADADEASVHAQVQLGRATVGDRTPPGATDTAPFLGVGARVTYATSNWYAYEASVWLGELTRPVRYTPDAGAGRERYWGMAWARADVGITARLGVRYIPTLHAALGVQRRVWRGRQFEHAASMDLPEQVTVELVGTLGAGLDYRLGDRWVAGVLVSGQRAVFAGARFQSIAGMAHISYYFYPEGAGP